MKTRREYQTTTKTKKGDKTMKWNNTMKAKYLSDRDHDDGIVLANDLFAYGMKEGGKWRLIDYFNSHTKAVNAVKRAKANWLKAFGEEKEFAAFSFNTNTSEWEKQ